MLLAEQVIAAAEGRVTYVQVYADWCAPCLALREASSDPLMLEAFAGTHVVQLNLEDWEAQILRLLDGPTRVSVPAFYEVASDGSLGRDINGHAWGENVPSNMAPPLRAFFRDETVEPATGSSPPEPRSE
jgi:thiol:disulfide interchange protein